MSNVKEVKGLIFNSANISYEKLHTKNGYSNRIYRKGKNVIYGVMHKTLSTASLPTKYIKIYYMKNISNISKYIKI